MCGANKNLINFIWWLDIAVLAIRVVCTDTERETLPFTTNRVSQTLRIAYVMYMLVLADSVRNIRAKKILKIALELKQQLHIETAVWWYVFTQNRSEQAHWMRCCAYLCYYYYEIKSKIIDSIFERRTQNNKESREKKKICTWKESKSFWKISFQLHNSVSISKNLDYAYAFVSVTLLAKVSFIKFCGHRFVLWFSYVCASVCMRVSVFFSLF